MSCLLSATLSSQTLHIYGGKNSDVYLGCLNCSKHDNNSIWNKYGTYGSKYSSNSIWNKYGTYGGQYSVYSPFNKYTATPPILVDSYGNFYGYFTANKYLAKRTTSKLALYITEWWESICEDVAKAYDIIFN